MDLFQSFWTKDKWSQPLVAEFSITDKENAIGFLFYSPKVDAQKISTEIKNVFPNLQLMGCSGAGEIFGKEVQDDGAVLTIAKFKSSKVKLLSENVINPADSYGVGRILSKSMDQKNLKGVFILCDGLQVNGSEIIKGLRKELDSGIVISGGLAGDGKDFKVTSVLLDADPLPQRVVVACFYGENLNIVATAKGGWLPFGPERKITKSISNVLYELDGKPALALYKEYLGEGAKTLPASGLNFPLLLTGYSPNEESIMTVRTLLAVNESEQSMTFAGNMPEGTYARLMNTSDSKLVEAARSCSEKNMKYMSEKLPILALAVSCVGRRLVMGLATDDELEATLSLAPKNSVQTGFYSYGELAPGQSGYCDLHNQTMTLTWIQEG